MMIQESRERSLKILRCIVASSLICSEVEGLTEDLSSPPIPSVVVYRTKKSSLFHPNYQAEAEFSMDIEPEDAPRDVPRGKLICHSLNTKNKLVYISFDLETDEKDGIIQMSAQIFSIQNNEVEV